MKKIFAILIAACLMLALFAACGEKVVDDGTTAPVTGDAEPVESDAAPVEADTADWDKIVETGKLVVGITIFAPMDYYADDNGDKDDDANVIGFDADLARAVGEKLGLDIDFQLVDWDFKETELKSRAIDCVWNGLTLNPELAMTFSDPYMNNAQVVIIRAADADKFTSLASLETASIAVESGSAGEKCVNENESLSKATVNIAKDQQSALLEVKSGTSDACVIDSVMAGSYIKSDTDFADLIIMPESALSSEEYAIGFRTDCGVVVDKVNEAIAELKADGTVDSIAEKYGLTESLIK